MGMLWLRSANAAGLFHQANASLSGMWVHILGNDCCLGTTMVSNRSNFVNLILLVIVLMILFGGGGFYYGGPYVGGGLGTILLIVLIILLVRG
jgi:hypothetical protein